MNGRHRTVGRQSRSAHSLNKALWGLIKGLEHSWETRTRGVQRARMTVPSTLGITAEYGTVQETAAMRKPAKMPARCVLDRGGLPWWRNTL